MSREPTESAEQIKFVGRVRHFYPDVLIFSVPNGGGRSAMEATKLKEEGVLSGVPDLVVAKRRGNWAGLYIEMKRRSGGVVSDNQREVLSQLVRGGYAACVAKGADEAWTIFETYMRAGRCLRLWGTRSSLSSSRAS